jgi:hypothetical protein
MDYILATRYPSEQLHLYGCIGEEAMTMEAGRQKLRQAPVISSRTEDKLGRYGIQGQGLRGGGGFVRVAVSKRLAGRVLGTAGARDCRGCAGCLYHWDILARRVCQGGRGKY